MTGNICISWILTAEFMQNLDIKAEIVQIINVEWTKEESMPLLP